MLPGFRLLLFLPLIIVAMIGAIPILTLLSYALFDEPLYLPLGIDGINNVTGLTAVTTRDYIDNFKTFVSSPEKTPFGTDQSTVMGVACALSQPPSSSSSGGWECDAHKQLASAELNPVLATTTSLIFFLISCQIILMIITLISQSNRFTRGFVNSM